MKKILAILMALAMIFSLAACGDKEDDDRKGKKSTSASEEKTEDAAAVKEAIFAATEEYYAAVLSCKGQKIKNIMPAAFEEIFTNEDIFSEISEDDKALISALYGIDFSSVTAAYEFYAIGVLSELGDVDDIAVEDVDYKKLSEKELKEETDELIEEGIEGVEFEDGAKGEAEILVTYSDGTTDVITQKLAFFKEDGVWKVCADDEDEGNADDGAEVTPPPAEETDDAALNAAATAYYDALLSGNGTKVKNSMSAIYEKMLATEDPFAEYTAEEKAQAEAELGISFSDPDAFYAFYAAMIMSETGDVTSIKVESIDYEKLPADEVATMDEDLAAEGITGLNITDCAEAEVTIVITYADGTTENVTQYLSFIKENGSWKAFPEV